MKIKILKPEFNIDVEIETRKELAREYINNNQTFSAYLTEGNIDALRDLEKHLTTIDLSELEKKAGKRYPKTVYYSIDPERKNAYLQCIEDLKEMMK